MLLGVIPTPFGASWENLDIEHLRTFFAAASDEGLTWEAKGGNIRTEHVIKAASAFGNSHLGGFLVLGARRASPTAPWVVDGYAFPTDPQTWVSQCLLNDAIRPRPATDTKSWPVATDRHVVVVNFRPVSVPPVITRDGQIWERLSGVSHQVRDPASMRELVSRGEQSRVQAASISVAARDDMLRDPPAERQCSLVVAMASPAFLGDVSTVIFTESAYQSAVAVLNGRLAFAPISGYQQNRVGGDVSQHALTLWNAGFPEEEGYCIRVGRHGSVTVGESVGMVESGLHAVANDISALQTAWEAAAHLLSVFVAEAPVHAAIALADPTRGVTEFARWTAVPGPWLNEQESIVREARRTLGQDEWEPEAE